jgi:glycosyltransferase involved in cell wall biosynthesis
MKILIIVPAYNEEKNLPRLFEKLKNNSRQWDVLVINDSSSDSTSSVCYSYGIKVIDLAVNLGIGGAVQTGYKYALYHGYDRAVQVDADGQHNPDYIEDMLKKLDEGWDLCIGSRFIKKEGFQSSPLRRAGIKYFSQLIDLLTGQKITDPTSGFRACNKKVISLFAHDYPRDYPEPESVVNLKKNGLTVCEIPVSMNKREEGRSSITPLKSIYYMIKVSLAIIITSIYKNRKVRD